MNLVLTKKGEKMENTKLEELRLALQQYKVLMIKSYAGQRTILEKNDEIAEEPLVTIWSDEKKNYSEIPKSEAISKGLIPIGNWKTVKGHMEGFYFCRDAQLQHFVCGIKFENAGKFIRVVSQGAAHSFIEKETGNIHAFASYEKPAKWVSANIYDESSFCPTYGKILDLYFWCSFDDGEVA